MCVPGVGVGGRASFFVSGHTEKVFPVDSKRVGITQKSWNDGLSMIARIREKR